MNTTIYYFSGTGNSLAVARDVAEKINGALIPAASVIEQERIATDAAVIGLVFPIYDFKPAKIIGRLIEKLRYPDTAYLFAVCTYGITPGKTLKHLEAMLKARGGKLSAGFAVAMPHNGLGAEMFSPEQHARMFAAWKIKRDVIAEYVGAGKHGHVETSHVFVSVLRSGLLPKLIPVLFSLFKQALTKGWDSLNFRTDEQCDGCGICARICPVKNIHIVNNRPSWSDRCEGCFACLHWCPKEAIQAGNITVNMPRYHHPDVKLSDLIHQ